MKKNILASATALALLAVMTVSTYAFGVMGKIKKIETNPQGTSYSVYLEGTPYWFLFTQVGATADCLMSVSRAKPGDAIRISINKKGQYECDVTIQ